MKNLGKALNRIELKEVKGGVASGGASANCVVTMTWGKTTYGCVGSAEECQTVYDAMCWGDDSCLDADCN